MLFHLEMALLMALRGLPPLDPDTFAHLERDARTAATALVRRRSQIILLAYELDSQAAIMRAVRCSRSTVARTLALFRRDRRSALRRPPQAHFWVINLAWQQALALALEAGPEACAVPRPTWTAPLLAVYLAEHTGIQASERTVRRYLKRLGYRLGRPTYTVRHKAEEQPDYAPKRPGSKCC